jgi:hypothetical protein
VVAELDRRVGPRWAWLRAPGRGGWRREFASRGVTLHQADSLVASATVGVGAALATANVADFPMPDLVVKRWPSDR